MGPDRGVHRVGTLLAVLPGGHDNIPFYVHCCRDSKYVSKIMLTHGMLETVQDHPTY